MPRTLHIESSISALQNRGGYLRVSVLDNSLDKIFRALSWLSAAASAFVRAVGDSAFGVVRRVSPAFTLYTLHLTPKHTPYTLLPTCPLSPLEPHWNLIGTSLESDWNLTKRAPRDHRGITER